MKRISIDRFIQTGYRYVARSKGRFYLYLAVFCSIIGVLDATTLHLAGGMKQKTFDLIMKNRILYREADSEILIIDIDEASLVAMAKEYGRWPWPRQVFAEFVENLVEQSPKAIIFDILFSDPDVYNPESDKYFDEVISFTGNTYFPMLRLAPQNDNISQITPKMIPGMGIIDGEKQEDKGIALVLPHFTSIVESGRMGTNNIYPDPDGIVRQYSINRDHYGWRIPSIPAKVAERMGWVVPQNKDILLNWRGKMGAFQTVRFSDVYEDFLKRKKMRLRDEFTNKILIIGSTASSLFDNKPTPMEKMHPGVEILATAIGNLKNRDWVTQTKNPWIFSSLAIVLIWATALAFLTGVKRKAIDRVFAGAWVGFMVISFASLNMTNYYIDLTTPIVAGLIYFSLARVYAYAEVTLMEQHVWLNVEKGIEGWQPTVVIVLQIDNLKESSVGKTVTSLKRKLNEKKQGFTIEAFPHKPAGIGRAYGNLILIYYVDDNIINEQPSTTEQGINTITLVKEVASTVCSNAQDSLHTGHCQGALPYGNEKGRLVTWQKLVTNAILNLKENEP